MGYCRSDWQFTRGSGNVTGLIKTPVFSVWISSTEEFCQPCKTSPRTKTSKTSVACTGLQILTATTLTFYWAVHVQYYFNILSRTDTPLESEHLELQIFRFQSPLPYKWLWNIKKCIVFTGAMSIYFEGGKKFSFKTPHGSRQTSPNLMIKCLQHQVLKEPQWYL